MASFQVISKFTFALFFEIIYLRLSSGSPIMIKQRQNFQCLNSDSDLTFELIKGYHHQLRTALLEDRALAVNNKNLNTIQLCIEACRQNPECHSLNYQQDIGCVLFKTNVSLNFSPNDAGNRMVLDGSNYYAQKICLSGADRLCAGRPWAFEVVKERDEDEPLSNPSENVLTIKKILFAEKGTICMEQCLNEKDFTCRLATFSDEMKECILTNVPSVKDIEVPSSSSYHHYRANCNEFQSSLENMKVKDDVSVDGISSENVDLFTDKENLNNSSSNKNQRIGFLKWLASGNSSKMMFIYGGIVVQLIALVAHFWVCYLRKKKMKIERATLQVATVTELMPPPYSNVIYDDDAVFYPHDPYYFIQIQQNGGEGQLQLPTYWEAVNIPSPGVEASQFNWEVIDSKVFYSKEDDPPPAYVEIESPLTDSINVSSKGNENAVELPPFYHENS